jgi:DNA-binding cell septation regulator SpoVG
MRKFQFVISLPCSTTAVRIAEVRTEARARALAERVLHESPQHLGVDVWEGENHLFSLGHPARKVA